MRKGLLGSLSILLTGGGVALAQAPATPDAGAPAAPAAVAPLEKPRSPYWPNPLGRLECLAPISGIGGVGANGSESCDKGDCFWADAEYLLWWVRKGPLAAPLLSTGTPTSLGILGAEGSSVVYGGNGLDFRAFSGARFGLGAYFDKENTLGIEGSGFFLEKRPADFLANSSVTGIPVFGRPVINALTGAETVELVSAPGVVAGSLSVTAHSGFYGWDVNAADVIYRDNGGRLELLAGFRYLQLDEDLEMVQNSVLQPGGAAGFAGGSIVPPGSVSVFDHFAAFNQFYGGQVGARWEWAGEQFYVSGLGKLALGSSHEELNIAGATTMRPTGGGAPTTVGGGLLALSSNIGNYSHNEFAVVPELGINIGYKITPCIRTFVGYSLIYWSEVARPGDQVNRTVNPALIPTSTTFGTGTGPAQPSFSFQRSDFWAQGVSLGLEIRY